MSKYIVIYDWMSVEFGNTAKRDVYALLYMHCKGGKVEYQCPQSYIAERLNLTERILKYNLQQLEKEGYVLCQKGVGRGNLSTYNIAPKKGTKKGYNLSTFFEDKKRVQKKGTNPTPPYNPPIYNDNIKNNIILNNNKPEGLYIEGANQVCTPPKKQTILERENEFKQRVYEYQHRYPPNTLNDFIDYWTEKNPKGVKMRFEFQKIFDLPRRLATWARKEQEYKFQKTKHNERIGNDRTELAKEIYEGLRRGDRRL